jgi:N-acetyl-anhydromuramyl-L-alanine amidase AmpD
MNKNTFLYRIIFLFVALAAISCATKKKTAAQYIESEKIYDTKIDTIQETLSSKNIEPLPQVIVSKVIVDSTYTQKVYRFSDSIQEVKTTSLKNGEQTEWIGAVNFNLRKPNFIIIHHTAQDSIQQTIRTFTLSRTKVSAHYVIGDDGRVVQMLNDYLRAWHAGAGSWGKVTDMNSCSIGIELDNNGNEPFSEAQIKSLLALLYKLTKTYNIPKQNIIGHSDIAPGRKQDPSALFPWNVLADSGFGLWKEELMEQAPVNFDPIMALKVIGYNIKNIDAAVKSFKLHYIQNEVDSVLDEKTINTIYAIYKQQ